MRVTALLMLIVPVALAAQTAAPPAKPTTPTQTTKPATPAAKPGTAAARPAAPRPAAAATLTTDQQKTIYALGLAMHRTLASFDLSAAELDILKRALSDAAAGKPAVKLDEWGPRIDPLLSERRERVAAREKASSVAYLAKAGAEAGAIKTASGLIYRDLIVGGGPSPTVADMVKVHYRGTLISGKEFDSSYERREPTEFRLNAVVPCWTEGVQRMKVGGKARLVCPSGLAYGDEGSGPIPGGATLIFEIELLEIVK